MGKSITAIRIDSRTLKDANAYCPYHGYRNFSRLVEDLVTKEIYVNFDTRELKKPNGESR